jgi:hypothetical protein
MKRTLANTPRNYVSQLLNRGSQLSIDLLPLRGKGLGSISIQKRGYSDRSSSAASNSKTQLGLVHTSAVNTLLKRCLVPGKVSRNLYENVHYTPTNVPSSLTHIEVTDDKVLLEFNEITSEYQDHAGLMFASDKERKEMDIPEWLVPVDLKNRTYCGGGATIFLDKKKVIEHFTGNSSSSSSKKRLASSSNSTTKA